MHSISVRMRYADYVHVQTPEQGMLADQEKEIGMRELSSKLTSACLAIVLFPLTSLGQGSFLYEYVRILELHWTPRSDWMNVREAGAKGDGITDDTDAIQQILNRLPPGRREAQGQDVRGPAGNLEVAGRPNAAGGSGAGA